MSRPPADLGVAVTPPASASQERSTLAERFLSFSALGSQSLPLNE